MIQPTSRRDLESQRKPTDKKKERETFYERYFDSLTRIMFWESTQ